MDIDQFKQFYTFTLRIDFCVLFLVSVLAEKCYNVHWDAEQRTFQFLIFVFV